MAPGGYRALEAQLRIHAEELSEIPAVVVSAFDRTTRMLPFVIYDRHLFPNGPRTIAAALHQAGFRRTRAVYQLWNPYFRPSRARIDGRPIQLLLVSALSIHAAPARALIGDAWAAGADRPLIIAGGPKAIYEPHDFWWDGEAPAHAVPDVAVTGEAYVLLDLLNVLVQMRGRGESMRTAFERARQQGALAEVPGLVYLAAGASRREPVLVDTGVQRLVQLFDELPHEETGLRLLEPPHRREELASAPLERSQVLRHTPLLSLAVTQGCKFHCPYCPIPAVNQRTWRFRSPQSLVHEMRTVHEIFGIKYFFGADDNFFNRRETAEELFSAMARGRAAGRPFGERLRFATEATQFDTYRNRDLLPTGRAGGLAAIWFGIEDLTAALINKGQKPALTAELFQIMAELKIAPMAMLMFHDGQPFYTPGSLYGLFNQIEFLRKAGAVSLQCTAHVPATGTREYEALYESGRIIRQVGNSALTEAQVDGNHIMLVGKEAAWKRQLKLIGAYAAFYNPLNFVRALNPDGSRLRNRRIGYQAVGMAATVLTGMKTIPYAIRLLTQPVQFHSAPPPRGMGSVATVAPRDATPFPAVPACAASDSAHQGAV